MDLAVEFNGRWDILEVKLIHPYSSPKEVLEEGLTQIVKYRNTIDSTASAYLIIFDRRKPDKKKPWDERLTWEVTDGIAVLGA
jgi:hypothetical protein